MNRAGIAGVVVIGGVAAFLLFQTLSLQEATCEVCMEYKGRSQCRTVAAASEEQAIEGAITNACAFISGGVTDSMACGRAKPLSVDCR